MFQTWMMRHEIMHWSFHFCPLTFPTLNKLINPSESFQIQIVQQCRHPLVQLDSSSDANHCDGEFSGDLACSTVASHWNGWTWRNSAHLLIFWWKRIPTNILGWALGGSTSQHKCGSKTDDFPLVIALRKLFLLHALHGLQSSHQNTISVSEALLT